jgi:hypothetical protein
MASCSHTCAATQAPSPALRESEQLIEVGAQPGGAGAVDAQASLYLPRQDAEDGRRHPTVSTGRPPRARPGAYPHPPCRIFARCLLTGPSAEGARTMRSGVRSRSSVIDRSGILLRIRPMASSARTSPRRSLLMRASIIARPDLVAMLEATVGGMKLLASSPHSSSCASHSGPPGPSSGPARSCRGRRCTPGPSRTPRAPASRGTPASSRSRSPPSPRE